MYRTPLKGPRERVKNELNNIHVYSCLQIALIVFEESEQLQGPWNENHLETLNLANYY